MWIVVFIVLGVVLVLIILNAALGWVNWHVGAKSAFEDLRSEIDVQMKYGWHNSVLRLCAGSDRHRYIDYHRVNPNRTRAHFDMIVDECVCQRNEFGKVKALLERAKVRHLVQDRPSGRCIVIECDRDTDLAARISRTIFTQIWRIPIEAGIRVKGRGHITIPVMLRTEEAEWDDSV